jgi:uncharacterized phage protein gp47/JayE
LPSPRPTLTALRTQAMQDITASGLPNADGFLRRSVMRVLAWVQAGLAFLHYGFLDWIALNATPFTATEEFLDAWAAIAPTPVIRLTPQAATGYAAFSTTGATIPAGTLMAIADAAQYVSTAAGVVSGSTVTVAIAAVVAGSAGNADIGSPVSLSTVVPGVTSSSGTFSTAIAGGTDVETDAALRTRMLESYANPPSGGDAADYVTWALEVPGVTRAWTRSNGMGAGTVVVYFMMDVSESAHNGFPQGSNGVATLETRDTAATGDQLAVANHLYPLEPVTALVYATAPVATPTNFTFAGLAGISTALQAQVAAAVAQLLVTKGTPLGMSVANIYQADVDAAVSAVPGLPSYSTTTPASWPIAPSVGYLLTVGTITYA